MTARPSDDTGAHAEFIDDEAARRAVEDLQQQGVPRNRILIDRHAPDQSGSPLDTSIRDKRTITNLSNLVVRGALLGLAGGAIFGAVVGSLVWSPLSAAWVLLAVGFSLFGMGLGILWSMMIGKGESTHRGTVYDDPGANQPTAITVRPENPDDVPDLLKRLEAAGGQNLKQVPRIDDKPER